MTIRHTAGAAGPPDTPYDADIIILTLDRTDETLAAVTSANNQTGLVAHIFVLDQGSRPENLARLVQAVHDRHNVTLLTSDENLGVAGGRNLLSGLGRGATLIGLDNDAVFATQHTAAHLVQALRAEPRLGAIGCRILTGDGSADDLSSWGYPASLLPCAGESFDTVTFVGAAHAIRRTAWEQAGGYDPDLFFCWEEYDFCHRAIALGWRIRYRGDIEIHHSVSPERRVAWTGSRWFYFVRNRLYIERKLDRPWPTLVPRIGGYLLKGLRNGLLPQTLRAIRAAAEMSPHADRAAIRNSARHMPQASRSYLFRNDRAHRGSLPRRLVKEVFGKPATAATTNPR